MPRSYNVHVTSPEDLRRRIEQTFQDDSLFYFREKLLSILRDHAAAVKEGGNPAFASIESLLARYELLIPGPVGDRFIIDGWIIQNLSESWSQGAIQLPKTILPLYGSEWMWQRLSWIEEKDGSGQRVYGISFIGRDQMRAINLLEYPWVCHELGHALFAKTPIQWLEQFAQAVDDYCRPLLKKLPSDSPQVRQLTKAHLERLRLSWLPRMDQQSWFHELVVDAIALWNCGPAFLAAMLDVVESSHIDPFLIESAHPPYALRLKALLSSSEQLGWKEEAQKLARVLDRWEKIDQVSKNHNHYAALTPQELVQLALSWALDVCRKCKIPRCDHKLLLDLTARRRANLSIDSAIELITSAWLVFESQSQTYADWSARTLNTLYVELKGNA